MSIPLVEESVIKVLLIDDEPDFVKHLSQALSRNKSFEVFGANDGMAGFELAVECRPDVILLDIMMPEPDGFEVLRMLKDNSHTIGIPVVMLTAVTTHEARLNSLKLYSEGFLEKPVTINEVVECIKSTLERRRDIQERLDRGIL